MLNDTTAAAVDRVEPTGASVGRASGYHRWHDLLFVHWRIAAEQLAPLLPRELAIDTWDGDAWVGLVPFHMSGVRPWWSVSVPAVSAFAETNVRTYVNFRGRPGVWFFSLDAASWLAVLIARRRWRLNYHRAVMDARREGSRLRYSSKRTWPGPVGAGVEISAEIGGPLGESVGGRPDCGAASPGTLEHFLIERYVLYCGGRGGPLFSGRVRHRPYPLCEARLVRCEQSLFVANDIHLSTAPCHVLYSPGVAVDVFGLEPIATKF